MQGLRDALIEAKEDVGARADLNAAMRDRLTSMKSEMQGII
jgi:hypothetical protein